MNVVPGGGACPPPVSGSLRGCKLVRSRRLPPFPQPGRSTRLRHALNQGPPLPGAPTRDLGLWGRVSWNDGHTETWAFTPIDRTVAIGMLLKGTRSARPYDEVGFAGVLNGVSKDHHDYLAAAALTSASATAP